MELSQILLQFTEWRITTLAASCKAPRLKDPTIDLNSNWMLLSWENSLASSISLFATLNHLGITMKMSGEA
jgi:hypothetical protein